MQKFKFSLFGLLILMFAGAGTATAQVLFFEDFQGGMPANFTLVNGDNNTPATNVAYVNDAWIVREDFIYDAADSVAFSTSWYTPAGAADDWMITPAITLGNNTVLSWDAVAPDGTYADGYEVEIASSPLDFAAGNGINIFTMPAEGQAWTTHTVNLSAYAGQTVYVAFHNNSFDDFLLMIEDIMLEEPTSAFDAAVNAATNMHPEYTIFPISQAHPFTLEAEVMNTGANAVTNVQLEVNVLDGNLNVLNTAMSSAIASLAPTTTAMLSVPSYTPMDTGLYFAEYLSLIHI